ncbi:hypothetical protein [Xanthomonas vesicatoria]|uniref:hypothetical protein n=1 Tax=Xanthomonas vesicatoria TaxID=56460 RepID=UPI0035567649
MGEAGAEQQHGEKQSTHEGLRVGAMFGFFVDAAALLLLFAVCCLLFAVCCLLFAVCCLLFAVCCLLFAALLLVLLMLLLDTALLPSAARY